MKRNEKSLEDKIELFLAGNIDIYASSIVQQCVPHGEYAELLGVGGEKLVVAYRDTLLDQKRVLNIRLPGLTIQAEKRFFRGARILNRIMNKELLEGRVPPFPLIFEISDSPAFYTTQYISGGSLREFIEKQTSLSLPDKLWMFARIGEGIHLLHTYGTVHRDIKPDNVMIDQFGFPKIIDFGISMSCYDNPLTRTDAQLGTPEYAAPEQMQDAGSVDPRADIFALGKVLYFMITGEESFDPVNLPLELVMVVPKALQSDRERRPATVMDFMAEVQDAYPDFDFFKGKDNSKTADIGVARAFIDMVILYGCNPGKIKKLFDLSAAEWEELMAMAKACTINVS